MNVRFNIHRDNVQQHPTNMHIAYICVLWVNINPYEHIDAETNRTPFGRGHFQMQNWDYTKIEFQ